MMGGRNAFDKHQYRRVERASLISVGRSVGRSHRRRPGALYSSCARTRQIMLVIRKTSCVYREQLNEYSSFNIYFLPKDSPRRQPLGCEAWMHGRTDARTHGRTSFIDSPTYLFDFITSGPLPESYKPPTLTA